MTLAQMLCIVAFAPLAIGIMFIFHCMRESSGLSILEKWARAERYEIIEQERRHWFARGPFTWGTTQNQTVYRVTVRDGADRQRRGWVRCGSWWFGTLVDQVEVRWDDESLSVPPTPRPPSSKDGVSLLWDREIDY